MQNDCLHVKIAERPHPSPGKKILSKVRSSLYKRPYVTTHSQTDPPRFQLNVPPKCSGGGKGVGESPGKYGLGLVLEAGEKGKYKEKLRNNA